MQEKLIKLLRLPDNAIDDQIIDGVVELNNRVSTSAKARKSIAEILGLPGSATDDQILSTVQGVQDRLNFHLAKKRQSDADEVRILVKIRGGLTRHQAWDVVQREKSTAAEADARAATAK